MNHPDTAYSPRHYLEKILAIMDIESTILEESVDPSTVCYRINCRQGDAKLLIGKRGMTLEALQYLVRQMCKSTLTEEEDTAYFILDVLDYRGRRKDAIVDQAKRAAVAVLNGDEEEVPLQAMSAFERRIVHNYLSDHYPEVSSVSHGRGPDRHIVVSYGGLPAEGQGEEGSSNEEDHELSVEAE